MIFVDRMNIKKRVYVIILVHFPGQLHALDDFTEYAVAHNTRIPVLRSKILED